MTQDLPSPGRRRMLRADAGPVRSGARRAGLAILLACAVMAFTALGVWQVERRSWKLGLIAAVAARVHAPAVPAPGPPRWSTVGAAADAYRHVQVRGRWLGGRDTLVQALTARGGGYWVMSPLRTADGWTVLVNRGFVPFDRADPATVRAGEGAEATTVTGLLRMTEPKGGLLRSNDPAGDSWVSRDVGAIAAARGLGEVAPFFIDAEAAADPGALPAGGLTVVSFRNSHLVYAITWFSLAGLSLFGVVRLLRPGGRS